MAHTRIHQNLQGINRTLKELKDYTHTYTFEGTEPHSWQHKIIKGRLNVLDNYLDNLREIELANTIPEVGDVVHRVQNLLEKIEQEAEERGYSPSDHAVLTDEPPVKAYVQSARNNLDSIISALELNPKEIAKNTLNNFAGRHIRRTRGRKHRTRGRRRKTRGRRRKTRGRTRSTRGHKHKTHRRK